MPLVSASSSSPKATPRTTLLLVDDDPFKAHVHRAALERHCPNIERAADASQAFIRIAEPGFRETLGLVLVGLRLPGVAGPAFVNELVARLPDVQILVIGRTGETASAYASQAYASHDVSFLPSTAPESELIAVARKLLALPLQCVA